MHPIVSHGIIPSSYQKFTPQTLDYIAAMTVKPSVADISRIDKFIRRGIREGWYSKLDGLWWMTAHDSQAARVNMIDPSKVATVLGTVTFTQRLGFLRSAAAGSYIDTQLTPTILNNYKLNTAHLSLWVDNNIANGVSDVAVLGNVNYGYLNPNAGSGILGAINMNGGSVPLAVAGVFTSNGTINTAVGHAYMQRVASNLTEIFKDRLKFSSVTNSGSASSTIPTGNLALSYATANRRMSGASVGASMADAEVVDFMLAYDDLLWGNQTPECVFAHSDVVTTAAVASHTFTAVPISTAAPTRKVVVAVTNTTNINPTSVTIGGVSAVLDKTCAHAYASVNVYSADVPTGTTADVVVTHGSAAARTLSISVYSLYNLVRNAKRNDGIAGQFNAGRSYEVSHKKGGVTLFFFEATGSNTGIIPTMTVGSQLGLTIDDTLTIDPYANYKMMTGHLSNAPNSFNAAQSVAVGASTYYAVSICYYE